MKTECPQCGTKLKVSDELAGKACRCPRCKARVPVPPLDELDELPGPPTGKQPRKSPWLTALGITGITGFVVLALPAVVILSLCAGCAMLGLVGSRLPPPKATDTSKPAAQATKPEAPSLPEAEDLVTAHTVYLNFANVLHARKVFEGRKYIVVGAVANVDTSLLGRPVVVIKGDDLGLERIHVHLPAEFGEAASKLQENQLIGFYGEVSGEGRLSIRMKATDMGAGPEWGRKFHVKAKDGENDKPPASNPTAPATKRGKP